MTSNCGSLSLLLGKIGFSFLSARKEENVIFGQSFLSATEHTAQLDKLTKVLKIRNVSFNQLCTLVCRVQFHPCFKSIMGLLLDLDLGGLGA